jgi:DNA-binding transcriptional ArsR family regulator
MNAAQELDRTLAALADPRRRRVVDLLSERPHRAGELAQALSISFPAMSQHLRALRESGLVAEERDALDSRARIYRLQPARIAELKAWIEATEALWTRQLLAFKAHLSKPKE